MPLIQGSSDAAKSKNISQLMDEGRKQDQAVAIAMDVARRTKRAEGGIGLPKLDVKPHLPRPRLHTGPIHSSVAGRTDHLPIHVPNKAYVLPADIVSGMGQGNTMAGFKIAKDLPDRFHRMIYGQGSSKPYGQGNAPYGQGSTTPYGQGGDSPYGHELPHKAGGGSSGDDEDEDEGVPIVAAGGEHVYHPREVAKIGNGDVDLGHDILDAFVKAYRAEHIKTLKSLPGPKHD
jgi:hypothetical protein